MVTALAVLALVCMPAVAWTQTVHLVTGDNYRPYVDRALPGGGLLAVLIRKVCAEMGREIEISFLPWRRAYRDTQNHGYSATFPYRHTDQRAREMLYLAPRVIGRVVAVVLRSAGWSMQALATGNPRVCRAIGYRSTAGYPVLAIGRRWHALSDRGP